MKKQLVERFSIVIKDKSQNKKWEVDFYHDDSDLELPVRICGVYELSKKQGGGIIKKVLKKLLGKKKSKPKD